MMDLELSILQQQAVAYKHLSPADRWHKITVIRALEQTEPSVTQSQLNVFCFVQNGGGAASVSEGSSQRGTPRAGTTAGIPTDGSDPSHSKNWSLIMSQRLHVYNIHSKPHSDHVSFLQTFRRVISDDNLSTTSALRAMEPVGTNLH